MNKERRRLLEDVIQLVYFMRGAIQYTNMLDMTYVERQAVGDFISKRLEEEAKKMYPTY